MLTKKPVLPAEPAHKLISRRQNGSVRVITPVGDKSLTDESFKDECDVNNIIQKFKKTGNLTHVSKLQGTYGDFSDIPDLNVALQTVQDANNAFDALPSHVRNRFSNDPSRFLDFMSDPENDKEAIKLGLKIPNQTGHQYPDAGNKDEVRVSPPTEHTPGGEKPKKAKTKNADD